MENIGDIEPYGKDKLETELALLVEGRKYSFIMEEDLQIISGDLVRLNGGMVQIRFDGCINIVAIRLDSIKAFRLANA